MDAAAAALPRAALVAITKCAIIRLLRKTCFYADDSRKGACSGRTERVHSASVHADLRFGSGGAPKLQLVYDARPEVRRGIACPMADAQRQRPHPVQDACVQRRPDFEAVEVRVVEGAVVAVGDMRE